MRPADERRSHRRLLVSFRIPTAPEALDACGLHPSRRQRATDPDEVERKPGWFGVAGVEARRYTVGRHAVPVRRVRAGLPSATSSDAEASRSALEPRVLEVLAYLVAHAERVVPKRELLDRPVAGRGGERVRPDPGRQGSAPGRSGGSRTLVDPHGIRPRLPVRRPGDIDAGRGTRARRRPVRSAPGRVPAPLPSIAVLPFADLSPAHDQGYFCEGLAEELIGALTRIEGLFVASRTSSFQFRGPAAATPGRSASASTSPPCSRAASGRIAPGSG